MKRVLALLLVVCMMFTITACGNAQSEEPVADDTMKVALVVPGPVNDGGWCAVAYQGLLDVETEFGAEISYTENVQATDMEAVFTDYASQGYDVVIGHGFQFGDPALKVGAKYPDTKFVCIEAAVEAENVASYVIKCEEAGYLMGILAASMSESGNIGIVSGMEGPSLIKIVEAYKIGAREVNPDIKVSQAYTGSFDDVAKAKEAAMAMINNGADVLGHCANQAGMGVIKAAEENGLMATGDSYDQNFLAEDTIMSSTVYNVPVLIKAAVSDVMNGTFVGGIHELGMKEGVVDIAPYNSFADKVPTEVQEKIAKLKAEIISGDFTVQKVVEITN
jgi:basic membrane protein A